MPKTPMTRILSLKHWQQILLAALAFLLFPLTLILILWYLNDKNTNYDMRAAKKQKEKVRENVEETKEKVEDLMKENKELKEKREELLQKVEERNEKASRIANDIPRANNLEKLERIRQRINNLK